MVTDIKKTIKEREQTHGDFGCASEIAQKLKGVMFSVEGWDNLAPPHREALDMIATKLARILNGKPNHADHWRDIAGYAMLAEELVGIYE